MGVSKGLNRLAILGLLACGGVWAQTVPVLVGLSSPGPIFLVDGQAFTTPQVFQWEVGSNHQIYFLQSEESNGVLGNHQYPNSPGTRYTFGGWTVVGEDAPSGQAALLILTVQPTLTQILGNITTEVQLYVYFNGYSDPNLPCSSTAVPNDPREGVVTIGSSCFAAPAIMWVTPGPISLTAAPFPGFIFTNWLVNGNVVSGQTLPSYQIVGPTNISAVFTKAKRVRFRSSPPGLSLFVDHQIYTPGPVLTGAYSGDPYCPINYSLLPIGFPVGYVPLCVGDFDFLPGSQHVIAAPSPQTDGLGTTWVFTGFSDGLGQNGVYTADDNVTVMDTVYGNFVKAVPTRVLTDPPGLTVNIDGQDDSKGMVMLWADGQVHHLIAPATQTDATGHPWQFVSWSNGGTADQNYTVPTGLAGLNLIATYEPQGKLQVDSVPSGLAFNVDGAACTTPCILLSKPTGAQVTVIAPPSLAPDAFRRYTFKSWNSGSTASTFQVTIGDHAQVFVATYQAFYKLTATSQPVNEVNFTFNPSSADGFYTDGTQVAVTESPKDGFTFKVWSGDLSGTNPTASLVMSAPRFPVAVLNGFPFISQDGVQNAAGATPADTVGPGSDIAIYGSNLADQPMNAPPGELVQALGDTWVTLNDRLLPLSFISPDQINAQLFSDLQDGDYTLTVHHTTTQDASRTFTVRRDSPGIFQYYPDQASPTVLALHSDGSLITSGNPATVNETISIFGTGFGLYDQPMVDGFPTPDTGIWNVVDPVTVTVDGQTYTPVSSRAANGAAGVVLVRVKLTKTPSSGLVNLKVTVNNVDSNTTQLPTK